jgi:mono/diheme cytochrome c family protein
MSRLAVLALGMALGFAAVGLGGLGVIEFGLFDTTATKPHSPLVAWAAHAAMIHSVRVRAGDIQPPDRLTGAEVLAGFADYDTRCALCHGGPGVGRAPWVSGLTPTPPFLIEASRQWSPAQLDLIVGQGVKMTAMPGWSTTLSSSRIWNIVAFLEALPYLTPRDYATMRTAEAARGSRPASRN